MQASAPMTIPMGGDAFGPQDHTTLYWLGSGGIFINSRGSLVMVDPVISVSQKDPMWSEAEKRLLVPTPLVPAQVPRLDAVLYTHADYDHMGRDSALGLQEVTDAYYGTMRSVKELDRIGVDRGKLHSCAMGEAFGVKGLRITPTSALHEWPREDPYRPWDCCGFLLETPDGTVWAPGDSVLLGEHMQIEGVDALFLDFSDDPYHFGLENAVRLANNLPDAWLLPYHYGSYDAPDKPAFSADPASLEGRIKHPERIRRLAPGEKFTLGKRTCGKGGK